MYLLFYSKYCKYSAKFIQFIEKIHYSSYFETVSVDKQNGKRHPFVSKYNIKEVPSIIVNQRVYTGKEAFKWLESKIKNSNTTLPIEDTRKNKIPSISGYTPDILSMNLTEPVSNFDGNSNYSSLKINHRIQTPVESDKVEKPTFILPQDSITGNIDNQEIKKPNKDDIMKKEYELLQQQRNKQDSFFKQNNSSYM